MKLNMNMNEIKDQIKKINFSVDLGKKNKKDENPEKKKLKQRDKGILMILGSVIIGYCAYNFLLTPVNKTMLSSEKKSNEVARQRSDLELELEKKVNTQNEINTLKIEVDGYTKKFPNTRTRNEILVVLNTVISGIGGKLDSVEVGNSTPLTTSDVGLSIQTKGIAPLMKDAAYFTANISADAGNEQGTAQTSEDGKDAGTAPKQPFESTLATIKVSDLSYSEAYAFIDKIHKTERLVVPKTMSVIKSDGSKYNVEGDLLFYTYRNTDPTNIF